MKRILLAALLIGLLSGCQMKNKHKTQAYERWAHARARVVCGVAAEHLKVGDVKKALTTTREALAMDENYVPARVLLGKVLLAQGRYANAAEELRITEVLAPDDPEVAYLLGVALEKHGRHEEALRSYQKARALDPSKDAYVAASAEVLVAMDQPVQALELMRTRLARREGGPGMNALAGDLALLVGRPDEAAGFYRACLDADGDSVTALEGLAKARFFAGEHDGALECLGRLAGRPEYAEKVSWVYIMMGDCNMALKRPRRAREAYETATRIEPDTARIWMALAKAALSLGDLTRATSSARRATALGGPTLEATMVLAYALVRQQRWPEAARMLQAASEKHPDDATVLCMLGRCHQAMGRSDQATSCYLKVLRSHPRHVVARSLLNAAGAEADGAR